MKKSYLLILVLLISIMLTSCKVEMPDKVDSADGNVTTSAKSDSNNNKTESGKDNTTSTTKEQTTKPTSGSSTVTKKPNVTNKYNTDQIPQGKPTPVEPQDSTVDKNKKYTATLSITCKTILSNMDKFNKDKLSVLPTDGIIYSERQITFSKGESVFDVLVRETKKNRIHMEFVNTPMYNSAYIEGINNIYEFDCGERSGWMYKVNGWFPNYGCSRYELKEGDKIEWIYTCDLGRDIGCEWLNNSKAGG